MSTSLQPHGLWPTRLLCSWDSPDKNTGVGCHALLQGIFPTQGLNSRLFMSPALAGDIKSQTRAVGRWLPASMTLRDDYQPAWHRCPCGREPREALGLWTTRRRRTWKDQQGFLRSTWATWTVNSWNEGLGGPTVRSEGRSSPAPMNLQHWLTGRIPHQGETTESGVKLEQERQGRQKGRFGQKWEREQDHTDLLIY